MKTVPVLPMPTSRTIKVTDGEMPGDILDSESKEMVALKRRLQTYHKNRGFGFGIAHQ